MKKFTAFTVILTVIVLVVLGETIVNEYFPDLVVGEDENTELTLPENLRQSAKNDVLSSDLEAQRSEDAVDLLPFLDETQLAEDEKFIDPGEVEGEIVKKDDDFVDEPFSVPTQTRGDTLKDFEDENFMSPTNTVYLREEQIRSAGFVNSYLESEPFDDRLFKSILVDDLNDVKITKTAIRTKDLLLAKIYIFKAGIDSNISEIYQLLRLRANQGLGVKINETNEYGLASFYLNDPNRSATAFLVLRISNLIYGFSYPKEYHPQVKNLIKLIEWELG